MDYLGHKIADPTSASATSSTASLISILHSLATISRLHIIAIAAMATLTFGWLFTGQYLWVAVTLSALDWFIINLVNQTVDLKEDAINKICRVTFTLRHRRILSWTGIGLALVSFGAGCWINPILTWPRIGFHLLGAMYNWPLLPGKRRLKQLYFWKNTASALGFLITVFGYPLASIWPFDPFGLLPGDITWQAVGWVMLFFFLFEVSYEVIYDIRDVNGDAAGGIRTYAVVHGVRGAVRIIDALIVLSMAILAFGFLVNMLPWRITIMAAAPLIQLVFYKRALRRGISAKDCIVITWIGVALLVIYNLWVAAELPGLGAAHVGL